jgi:hypothetical protein
MIVPGANNPFGNLILLKDGSTANPVSGIPHFNSMSVGNTLSLSYTRGTSHNGIVDIKVIKFTHAKDSTFIPNPPGKDSTAFVGLFSGVVYKTMSSPDSSSTDSLSSHVTSISNVSISFSKSKNYNCTGASSGYPEAGHGTYTTTHGTFSWLGTITFTDQATSSNAVLNGTYSYYITAQNLLCLYATRNGFMYSFYLSQK